VALAHLQFEAALAPSNNNNKPKPMPLCAGRTFNVTDEGAPPAFADIYAAAQELCATRVRVTFQNPLVLFLLAHVVEAWCLLLARLPPSLTDKLGLREPSGPLHMLQPSVFSVAIHTLIDDSQARKSVAEGGIGYRAACTTLEGVCQQILEWNREHEGQGQGQGRGGDAVTVKEGPDGTVAKAALTAKGVVA
jgi:hypothetical protein